MSEYELRFDTGVVAVIRAKTRGQAIDIYCAEHGAPRDWVAKHCTVKNLGRV